LLAGRFDDPGQHQITKHLIASGGGIEPEDLVGPAQRVPQVAGLRVDDLKGFAVDSSGVQPEIEGSLAFGQPLAGGGFERFGVGVVMG
jgi:hypothetical protein